MATAKSPRKPIQERKNYSPVVPAPGSMPLMRIVAQLLNAYPRSVHWIVQRAGLSSVAGRHWFKRNNSPSVANLEAVLNVIGYELGIYDRKTGRRIELDE